MPEDCDDKQYLFRLETWYATEPGEPYQELVSCNKAATAVAWMHNIWLKNFMSAIVKTDDFMWSIHVIRPVVIVDNMRFENARLVTLGSTSWALPSEYASYRDQAIHRCITWDLLPAHDSDKVGF